LSLSAQADADLILGIDPEQLASFAPHTGGLCPGKMCEFLDHVTLDSLVGTAGSYLPGKGEIVDSAFSSGEKYVGQSTIQRPRRIGSVSGMSATIHQQRATVPPIASHSKRFPISPQP